MSDRFVVDPPQLDLLLKQLRLPTMRALWRSFTERADREGWPTARLLAALASHEVPFPDLSESLNTDGQLAPDSRGHRVPSGSAGFTRNDAVNR